MAHEGPPPPGAGQPGDIARRRVTGRREFADVQTMVGKERDCEKVEQSASRQGHVGLAGASVAHAMTFSRRSMRSHRASCMTGALFTEGMARMAGGARK